MAVNSIWERFCARQYCQRNSIADPVFIEEKKQREMEFREEQKNAPK
jgi:hypothetical protein